MMRGHMLHWETHTIMEQWGYEKITKRHLNCGQKPLNLALSKITKFQKGSVSFWDCSNWRATPSKTCIDTLWTGWEQGHRTSIGALYNCRKGGVWWFYEISQMGIWTGICFRGRVGGDNACVQRSYGWDEEWAERQDFLPFISWNEYEAHFPYLDAHIVNHTVHTTKICQHYQRHHTQHTYWMKKSLKWDKENSTNFYKITTYYWDNKDSLLPS